MLWAAALATNAAAPKMRDVKRIAIGARRSREWVRVLKEASVTWLVVVKVVRVVKKNSLVLVLQGVCRA
jgi:hypothetical protein